MENLLATVVFCVTLSVVCGQAANAGGVPQAPASQAKAGAQAPQGAGVHPPGAAAPASGPTVNQNPKVPPGAPTGASVDPKHQPAGDHPAEPTAADPNDQGGDLPAGNITGAPQCWLCSDYNLDDGEEGDADGGTSAPQNETLTARRKRSTSTTTTDKKTFNGCKAYDPSDPTAVYGTLVPRIKGFKCFVFHENNRSGKVVMRGMLPLHDLKLFNLEENGCKDDVASGDIIENVKFYACACEGDKCNANSAPLFARPSTVTVLVVLAVSMFLK